MPQYQVDSERIQSSSAAVSASIAAIRQAVNGMYTNLNGLQDAWRGGAATQFTSVSAPQQQMEASLESIQQALTQASTVYADAEAQASRLFASG